MAKKNPEQQEFDDKGTESPIVEQVKKILDLEADQKSIGEQISAEKEIFFEMLDKSKKPLVRYDGMEYYAREKQASKHFARKAVK